MGMIATAAIAVRHFFTVNFPPLDFERSFWDLSASVSCEPLAYSIISRVGGVPLGYVGLVVGCLLCLGAAFPSTEFGKTNRCIALLNVVGAAAVSVYSILQLKSLCLFCVGYFAFAALGFLALRKQDLDVDGEIALKKYLRPSFKHLAAFTVFALAGAYGFSSFYYAKRAAQGIEPEAGFVERYFNLPRVAMPSIVSPYLSIQGTEKFEDAPIRVVAFGDFLCSDSLYLTHQIARLKQEFEGKLNVAFQFFPLDGECNNVVNKDIHPGSCELSYLSAYDPSKFREIHDEVFANQHEARDPEWRMELARRYGVEAALEDSRTKELVHRLIHSGAEYERTSAQYPFGIRSTPTIILNDRMIIGTLPYAQLRAIFRALLLRREDEYLKGFIEYWMPPEP
jgi:protein-disulfide isomerase/uncharacterized membrane protein